MRFAPMKEILELAEERKIAYGAFVTVSYETALAAIEAGSYLHGPVIFITCTECCDLMGGERLLMQLYRSRFIWITAELMRSVYRLFRQVTHPL